MKFAVQRSGSAITLSEDHFYLSLLALLAFMTWVLVTYMALVLHGNFLTVACDSAAMQSALVNTMHGHWFRDTAYDGPNLLGIHTAFLLPLLIPFYVVLPHIETLFVVQAAGVFSSIFPIFLIARDVGLKPLPAFVIAATSLLSAFLMHMAMAPLHLETWIAAAALWSYHFYLRNNLVGFILSLLFAVCCGEQAAVISIALGVSLLLVRDDHPRRRFFGLMSLVFGLAWLAFAVGVVAPHFAGSSSFNIFAYNYSDWKVKSAGELPGALVRNPRMALEFLFSLDRWEHIASVIGLLLLTAFFSWRSIVLLLLPLPAYLLMSDQEFTLYFHAYYYSFAFFAGYVGLLHLLSRINLAGRLPIVGAALFLFVAVATLCHAVGYYYQLSGATDEPFSTELRAKFAEIPPTASVYGPHRYSAYLSNRDNFVMGDMPAHGVDFDAFVNEEFNQSNVHADQIDFIVSDYWTDQCGWRQAYMSRDDSQRRLDAITALVDSGKWQVFWQERDVVILQRVKPN